MLAETPLDSASGDSARTRCVLLAAGGEQPPERLMRLLDQPSTETVTVAHPLLAAAELALLERARHADVLVEFIGETRTVLVVVNRESWRDLSPLFRTVRLQMPEVSIWVCTERVAIEVYAGSEVDEETTPTEPIVLAEPPSIKVAKAVEESPKEGSERGNPTDVSDEELQRLLELYDAQTDEQEDPEEAR